MAFLIHFSVSIHLVFPICTTLLKSVHIISIEYWVTRTWQVRCKSWKTLKKLQNVINDQNVENSDQLSESYKIWTMAKMSNVVIKKKFTISEQWAKCHLFWSKVKKLQNLNNLFLTIWKYIMFEIAKIFSKAWNVTRSEQIVYLWWSI